MPFDVINVERELFHRKPKRSQRFQNRGISRGVNNRFFANFPYDFVQS
jgi:hypothetical protein